MTIELYPHKDIVIGDNPTTSIIWTHGGGEHIKKYEAILPRLKLPASLGVRFVFPQAPTVKVNIKPGSPMSMIARGDSMTSWFQHNDDDTIDTASLETSRQQLEAFIEREIERGIPSEKIALIGFSQGGALGTHTGLRYDKPLAGITGLSTFHPTVDTLAEEGSEANKNIPIFYAHGTKDVVIKIEDARETKDKIVALGYNVDWREYENMNHALCPEEIADIAAWIVKVLS